MHIRSVELASNEFSVTDEITGPDGEHDVEQYWHFAHEPREISRDHWIIGDLAEFSAEGGQSKKVGVPDASARKSQPG